MGALYHAGCQMQCQAYEQMQKVSQCYSGEYDCIIQLFVGV